MAIFRPKRLSSLLLPVITVVIIATILYVIRNGGREPRTEIERVRQAMRDGVTRQFRADISLTSALGEQTVDGVLIVRGETQFVWRIPIPVLGTITLGNDGQHSWGVPPTGPVFVSPDSKQFANWLGKLSAILPANMLHIDGILEKLLADYDLQRAEAAPARTIVIEATRLPGADRALPEHIQVEADSSRHIVKSLTMTWPGKSVIPRPRNISLIYEGNKRVAEDYFQHTRHHEPDRPVVSISAAIQASSRQETESSDTSH